MALHEYCIKEAIICDMEAGDKEDAVRQLVAALSDAKAIPKTKAAAIRKEIIERERRASTGIGNGVGIPHARTTSAKKISIAIGKIPGGIDFGAVDGERVRVILLLVSPQSAKDEHLKVMKTIVGMIRDPYQCKRLHGCSSADSFVDLLAEMDVEV